MTDSFNKTFPKEESGNKKPEKKTELDEIRRLLFDREQTQIVQLKERLDNPKLLVKDVERVLPEAIKLRSSRDKEIAKALEPNIEEGLRVSIKKNPQAIADTLYPVMGPSIRKAIYSIILNMIQSFNKILEHTFSIQGLKWRMESLITKKPFAEIVLLNTLIYQVEQVFLIHSKTGLVLQHVVAKEVVTQDPDLVAGMLTAIQDFVQDSFNIEKDESLDTLRIGGDRSVWVEQSPHATLAAVIRGTPPLDVRSAFREALNDLHLLHSEALESFDGNTAPFEAIKSQLESCLQFQAKEKERKISPLLWLILGGIVFFAAIWSFYSLREHQLRAQFLERLRGEPGIVVTTVEKRSGKYHITGLRDPLASDPMKILKETKLKPEKTIMHWESYHSFYPEFTLKRIKNILSPPETINLEFKNGTLKVKGLASYQWFVETRRIVKAIPGIVNYQEDNVVEADLKNIEIISEKIKKQTLLFHIGETEIEPDHMDILNNLATDISKLYDLAQNFDKQIYIEIVGHADSTGTEKTNMEISLKRANNVMSILSSKGIHAESIKAIGVGSSEPIREEITDKDRKFNRSVTFRVALTDN
ncbi:MAG: OmpA family protein [Desulfobacterales bacterium]